MAIKPKRYAPPAMPGVPPKATYKPGPPPKSFSPPVPPKRFSGGTPHVTDQMAGAPPGLAAGVGAPSTPSSPTVGGAPYPLSPQSQAARTGADETFGLAQGDINHQLYMAALQYGDPEQMTQYAPYAGDTAPPPGNPASDLATIERNTGRARTTAGNSFNQGNAFFSGAHQQAEDDISQQGSIERGNAWTRFTSARDKLMTALAKAREDRAQVYRDTGASDIAAALAKPPEEFTDSTKTYKTPPASTRTVKDQAKPTQSKRSPRKSKGTYRG